LAESQRALASDTEQAQQRIAEQTGKANRDLACQIAEFVRVAETLSRGGAVRARWLLTTAALGVVSCAYGFIAGLIAAAHNLFRLTAGG
jgi:hypothetical protein